MVGEQVETLFRRLSGGHPSVHDVPGTIHRIENPWYQAKRIETVQVGQIRRKLTSDTVFWETRQQLDGIDTTTIENRTISAASCCQHGDLHCANVVFDARGQAMLIDFGDTGPSFAAVDAVTLELSTVFHAQHVMLPSEWPSVDDMQAWVTVGRFAANCQFSPFIIACREWAQAEAASLEEVVASAYAYAARQLKYTDTDKQLARALIQACVVHLSQ
jgi:aminoglycoside phosphotransferase (APT) family kinase protein